MITVTEANRQGAQWYVQFSHMRFPIPYKTPTDALFAYLMMITGLSKSRQVAEQLDIPMDTLSRVRRGVQPIPDAWILWAHELTGADLASLRIITNTKPRRAT